jgi:hypothetical protein
MENHGLHQNLQGTVIDEKRALQAKEKIHRLRVWIVSEKC